VDVRTSLLDALRDHIGLTGTKKGCDHRQCGACTVLIDGRRELTCMTLAVMAQACEITTIEGLAGANFVVRSLREALDLVCRQIVPAPQEIGSTKPKLEIASVPPSRGACVA
jgi:aerobic-type carbon monoxide dehydrogenase small subunit (CoxS/CutS family)